MEFKFESNQQFQLDAINAVVDLFRGQPSSSSQLLQTLTFVRESEADSTNDLALEVAEEVGAVGNLLELDKDRVLHNLREVQNANGIEIRDSLANDSLDFDIEMETGTGKTYVYLRSIFELNKRYGFSKFIILVPSVAIREGVLSSIRLMRNHFWDLYSIPFDSFVYNGKTPDEVQGFASATALQIMVMTIDSIRGDKNTRIIHQSRDKLNGLRPIDFLSATHPIVIMDEPQNMESLLSQSAVGELNPLCTLRYSATHRTQRNVVYRLDPIDAHNMGLVKQIVVGEVVQEGADVKPYIKLIDVERGSDDKLKATVELQVLKDGSYARKQLKLSHGTDLYRKSGKNSQYEGCFIDGISVLPKEIEVKSNIIKQGEALGGNDDDIQRAMIRLTIREHLYKQKLLKDAGIKVLSLFFVNKVSNYLTYDDMGNEIDGKFARWFDEILEDELNKEPSYRALMPYPVREMRGAYFAEMKLKGSKKSQFVDSSQKSNANDLSAFEKIMKYKEELLKHDEPIRFIFSHSALKEGWDNPNVFQICVFRYTMNERTERRQIIGRGLRLPVNKDGIRVNDRGIAQVTVIANESYTQFAKSLQTEYKEDGVTIGVVRKSEFSKIPFGTDEKAKDTLGSKRSEVIWEHLKAQGFLDVQGRVLPNFNPRQLGFTVNLPEEFKELERDVIDIVEQCKMESFLKKSRQRESRKRNKELYFSQEFEEFWEKISRRTTYRVSVNRETIIKKAVEAIDLEPPIKEVKIAVNRHVLKHERGGLGNAQISSNSAEINKDYLLPDIVKELQAVTSLTRKTIIDILVGSGKLDQFIKNPADFMAMVSRVISDVLAELIVDGIQYEKIRGHIIELRELQSDGQEERSLFLDTLYKVKNQQKTDYDYIVYQSDIERQFAEILDNQENIKLFMKLPADFKIATPVGMYNPDWAIIKCEDGKDNIYMIRETKSTRSRRHLGNQEYAKTVCGRKHFEAIGIKDYQLAIPGDWQV